MNTQLRQLGSIARAGILLGVVALAGLICAAVAYGLFGMPGVVAAAYAAVISGAFGLLSLVVGDRLIARKKVLAAMGMGMMIRTVPPLALALYWHESRGELARVGIVYYMLALYMVVLLTETLLTVGRLTSVQATSKPLNTSSPVTPASQEAISGRMGATHG